MKRSQDILAAGDYLQYEDKRAKSRLNRLSSVHPNILTAPVRTARRLLGLLKALLPNTM